MEAIELTNQHLSRQLDLIPVVKLHKPIKVIGAGAIGSFAVLQLAKMGITDIEVWDHDTVSIENMNCQFYRFSDIGKPKVEALRDLVKDFTGVEIKINNNKWTEETVLKGIVIAAVDCMEVRHKLFDSIQERSFLVEKVIDSRMGAEDCLMYVMNPFEPRDNDSYRKTLYSNRESAPVRCTAKSTIYTANLLSGMVVKAVKNLICDEKYPRISMWSIANNNLLQYGSQNEQSESN